MHITASVFISDDEFGLYLDYEVWLEKLALTLRWNSTDTMDMRIMSMPI
jgi:hypothetical protein